MRVELSESESEDDGESSDSDSDDSDEEMEDNDAKAPQAMDTNVGFDWDGIQPKTSNQTGEESSSDDDSSDSSEDDSDDEDTTKKLSNKSAINKKALPDNIEIGTTLDEAPDSTATVTGPSKSKITSGKIGFIIGLVIIVLCWAIYTYDDSITQSAPQTAVYIDIFKSYVDYMQIARDDLIKN